jgi:hypothetical protein
VARALTVLALGALVVLLARALSRDLTTRRKEQALARIRSAFLHGVALAAPARGVPTGEVAWEGLVIPFPSTWQVSTEPGRLVCRFPLSTAPFVTAALGGSAPPGDASTEYLAEHRRLARWVEQRGARDVVAFVWCVSDAARSWTFRAELSLEAAHEVTAQADVARLDQAIRSMRFAGESATS